MMAKIERRHEGTQRDQFLGIRIDKPTLDVLREIAEREDRTTSSQARLFIRQAIFWHRKSELDFLNGGPYSQD